MSEHLSAFLNAFERSLPAIKLQQNSITRFNKIWEIIYGLINAAHFAIFGSLAEGLDVSTSDGDFTFFLYNYKVIDSDTEFYSDDKVIQFQRLPDKDHPGYSKLSIIGWSAFHIPEKYIYQDDKGTFFLTNDVKEIVIQPMPDFDLSLDFNMHGPALTTQFSFEHEIQRETAIFSSGKQSLNYDLVVCLESTNWPIEANEWTTRRRDSDWLTTELKNLIINTGYILAAVGSKDSKESGIQWRVSFNKAEKLMIESFNETQIHCILLLKFWKNRFLSNFAGKNINSYTLKTVMFWCLEEKSGIYWQSSNLMCCFCFCLTKLKDFVKEGFLPNYFIRKRNQFVACEFTRDIQTKTIQSLEIFLEYLPAFISMILPSCRLPASTNIFVMNMLTKKCFIERWLSGRVLMTHACHYVNMISLTLLIDENNIRNSFTRCSEAVEKLSKVYYTRPLIKSLQNYMGVLQYIILKEEKETGKNKKDSGTRNLYSKFMKSSDSRDLTHITLRIATCYLDDGVKEDCINRIRTVTDASLFKQSFDCRLKRTLRCDIKEFKERQQSADEIDLYNKIIYHIDFIDQDPYRTTEEFEQLKESGRVLIGYNSLSLAWKRSYFDVTFMQAEVPILPRPVAVEFCIGIDQKHISFHPYLYGLLLEYLWHAKYGSGNREKKLVLEKMENCVLTDSMIPVEQKSVELNFMAYCYSLQKDYQLASRCLVRSLKLNTVRKNVAYWYMFYRKYRIKRIRELSLDSQS